MMSGKILSFLLLFFGTAAAFGGDSAPRPASDQPSAETAVTPSPEQRVKALLDQFQALKSRKKTAEARVLLENAIKDSSYPDHQLRILLNALAGEYLWGPKYEYALELLSQARNLQAPKTSNEYYNTCYLISTIYLVRKNQPEAAMEVISELCGVSGVHPANMYSVHMMLGKCCEKLGQQDKALENYRTALGFAKKVTYKFDSSACKKNIERLTGK